MDKSIKKLLLSSNGKLRDAIRVIDDNSDHNMAVVIDDSQKFIGIVTNGDVTRAMLRGASLEDPIVKYLNISPVVLRQKDLNNQLIKSQKIGELLRCKSVFMPLLDEENHIKDIVHYLDLDRPIDDNHKKLSHKSILVIGGAGYLGSLLVKKLLDQGYSVTCFDNFFHQNYAVCDFMKEYGNLRIVKADMRNITHVVRSLEGSSAVVQLAAVVGDPACSTSPTDTIEINYLATKMIAEAARYSQVNRFIYASTCSVYGRSQAIADENTALNPVSLYAVSKIKSEEAILQMIDKQFSPTILRMSTLFGLSYRMRFDLVVNTLAMKAATEGKISIFGGEQWRPFLHVADAADAYLDVLSAPIEKIKGKIYNVGSEKLNYQISGLVPFIKKYLPETIVETRREASDNRDYRVSFKKIQEELNFYPSKSIDDAVLEIRDFVLGQKINGNDQIYSNSQLAYNNEAGLEDYILTRKG